ncbi:hypothetical protein ACO2Q0_02785 [Phenylobacterium sp. VNQ135]|uniref:hypothetical protein n=1 Tax=Phenylobacterium sp. VNQ135 TaxID=3400922 RepID=UPI003BFE3C6E
MAGIELARVDYGRSAETGAATVLITFAVDTGQMPDPVVQNFKVEVFGLASGDVAEDVAVARATLHRVLRSLGEEPSE